MRYDFAMLFKIFFRKLLLKQVEKLETSYSGEAPKAIPLSVILLSFKSSLKSFVYVFKSVHNYFGYYFLVLVFLIFWRVSAAFPDMDEASAKAFEPSLISLAKVFLEFMIPYYAYKYEMLKNPAYRQENRQIPPFWDFIREKVWPLVWNHIKATIIIFLFCLLLIIPGIYKAVRYNFLTESIFFSAPSELSALQRADKVTRGCFWMIFFYGIIMFSLPFLLGYGLKLLLEPTSLPGFLKSFLGFLVAFYGLFYSSLFNVHLYFHIKEKRGESFSLG